MSLIGQPRLLETSLFEVQVCPEACRVGVLQRTQLSYRRRWTELVELFLLNDAKGVLYLRHLVRNVSASYVCGNVSHRVA